jgi:hypothetical protein
MAKVCPVQDSPGQKGLLEVGSRQTLVLPYSKE